MSEVQSGEKHRMWKKKHPLETIVKMSLAHAGENNVMKRPEQRERMRNGGGAYIASFCKNPSKDQVQLYEKVKVFYPSAILNYPYLNYSIDIAITELKIAIEFDGYYHWLPGRQEADRKRQVEIEKGNWKFLRYRKVPDDNTLYQDLEGCTNGSDKKFPTTIV
jgi:hypothetical protein